MPITVTLCVLLNNSEWIFGTYKLNNVLTWLGLLLLCMIFLPVLIFRFFFFFSSSLLNYRFPYCIQFYTWSTQQVIVAQHMCWFLKASKSSNVQPYQLFQLYPIRADSFFFSFHIWSAIPDFSILPHTTAFRCSSSLTFSGQPVSPLYILPQLQGME